MSLNAKSQGHLATLARDYLECRSFDNSIDIFFQMSGPKHLNCICSVLTIGEPEFV